MKLYLRIGLFCLVLVCSGCGSPTLENAMWNLVPITQGKSYELEIGKTKKSDIIATFGETYESTKYVEDSYTKEYGPHQTLGYRADASSGVAFCQKVSNGIDCTAVGLPGTVSLTKIFLTFYKDILVEVNYQARWKNDKYNFGDPRKVIKSDWMTKAIPHEAFDKEDVSGLFK